jgi:hypothetical protein
MNVERKQAILQALWPPSRKPALGVWGVLDCARDPKIYLAMLESKLEFRCLYSGKLARELEMNAPHLVELFPSNLLIHRWLDEGWGKAWGVFLTIDDPSNLRHQLRKHLKVQDERGRVLLFRYYDPRVLGPFLRSCDSSQLSQFFGPVRSFLSEEAEGARACEFRFERNRLVEWSLTPQQAE